jgi:hypothetical protein
MNQTNVKVDIHFTRNLGNFESVKIGIGVEDWVRDGENTSTATDRVYKFVEEKVIEKINEIETEIQGSKRKK